MPPSWRLARSSFAGRRGRTALLVAAVALSCSLIVTVSSMVASVQATIERDVHRFIGATDARIIHPAVARFSNDLLDAVRTWPGVEMAAGRLVTSLTLIRADGRIDPATGQPYRITPLAWGLDLPEDRQLRPLEIVSGHDLAAGNEILLDPLAAKQLDAVPGDELIVQRFGAPVRLTVAGVYERLALGALQRPEVHLHLETAAEATNHSGELTSINLLLREGVNTESFCAEHANDVPAHLSLEPAEMARSGFDQRVRASRLGLALTTVLASMSALFIIVTGLTTGVTQQQREMAIFRTVGAARSQLFASQLWVGAIVGGLGALAGLPLGLALARTLLWHFADLISAGFQVSLLGLFAAVVGSLLAGLLGALFPAWRASRTSPARGIAVASRPATVRGLVMCAGLGVLLLAVQFASMLPADEQSRFWWWMGFGLPLVHVAYFLLAVPIMLAVTMLIGPTTARTLATPPRLLTQSLRATPFRHGFTAGALMVAMSCLVSTWSSGASLLDDWLGKIRFADGFVFRTTGISKREQQAIAAIPAIERVCPIGYLPLRIAGDEALGVRGIDSQDVVCVGFDPDIFFSMNAVNWIEGEAATAIARLREGDAIIVAQEFLTAKGLGVGDRLDLASGRVERSFEIVGVVQSPGLDIATQLFGIRSAYMTFALSCVFMDFKAVATHFHSTDAYMMQVDLVDAVLDEEVEHAVSEAAPGVRFHSGREIVRRVREIAAAALSVYSVIAFGALVVACLGVANILIAGIHSRRFEFGVIRAVGAHRWTLTRLILAEAALLAIGGALTGALLGLHIAVMTTRQYRDLIGLPLHARIPWGPIAIGLAVMLLMTGLAALPAALRLGRTAPRELLAAGRAG
jgi:putative ABC transport system permease protein